MISENNCEKKFKNYSYIIPRLRIFQSFKEAQVEIEENRGLIFNEIENKALNDYFNYKRTIVIAEPGYGKTRLLKEFYLNVKSFGRKSFLIDLKKIPENVNIEDFIYLQTDDFEKDKNFKIVDSENIILCFDGLDEVKQENFSEVIDKIKSFDLKYPKVFLVLSCRWHFFKKYQEIFADTEYKYLYIYPFSIDSIRRYLSQASFSEDEINKIFNSLQSKHRDLIIQTPRYLEFLVNYIKENEIKDIKNITRADLFEYFIYHTLEIEDVRLNEQKRDLIKRVLEKLALVMEIYQTNLITKDELMTFFDELNSDLKLSLLHQIPIEIFYDKSLIKDNGNTVEFDNTEFQEYLAAKEITRFGNIEQTVFELSVDTELHEIFPSWFNTLAFLLELDISLLKPILNFGSHNKERYIQDEEYHRFLTRVNVQKLKKEDRKIIFEEVLDYYQNVLHWIDGEIARNLSYYFDISQEEKLKRYFNKRKFLSDTERFVQLGNIAKIIGSLFDNQIFDESQKNYWKRKLIKLAISKNDNGVLQRYAISALGHLKDDVIIDKVSQSWEGDTLVKDEFLRFCTSVNPNHRTSIKYFVEGTKLHSIYARFGIYLVSKKNSIKRLLQYFIDDELFAYSFIDKESIFKDSDYKITKNIKSAWDNDIRQKLEILLQKIFKSKHNFEAERSGFVKSVVLMLKENNNHYIFKLLDQISQSDKLKNNIFSFKSIFALILEYDQVEDFIKKLSKFQNGEWVALWTLQEIKFSKREDAEAIYNAGRKYIPEQYDAAEKKWKEQEDKPSEELQIYNEFKQKYNLKTKEFRSDIFNYYFNHSTIIEKYITSTEKEDFVKLITGIVFDKFDPGNQKLTISNQKGRGYTYSTHRWISIFGDCIKVVQKLHLDVKQYRKRIINYIPFSYYEHLEAIFELVQNITSQEISGLLNVYKEKTSDLWKHMPNSLIEAVKNYSIKEAAPILKEFVEQEEFSIDDRIASLETLEMIEPNKKQLDLYFKKFQKNNKLLAVKSNELLIENFKDLQSINWRVEQIMTKAFKFSEQRDAHWVSDEENELHEKNFASPIMRLKDLSYKKKYFDILDYSFELIKKDKMYYSYAQYLWEIVYSYFDNLKEKNNYEPLKELENYLKKHSTYEGINWFSLRMKELIRSYMNYIGKPKKIAECILLYNNLKSKKYLRIINAFDLFQEIKNVIEKDLKTFIYGEGKKIIELDRKNEKDIQKILKISFENTLLRKGFRPSETNEITILRESQLLDDKRTDFLIFYGFIGPIIVEIKLGKSDELTGNLIKKKSYKSMVHYMQNYKAHYGIFLVIGNRPGISDDEWKRRLDKIINVYQNINNTEVINLLE